MIVTCSWCGSERNVVPARAVTFKYCSLRCKGDAQSASGKYSGANSPRWTGGERVKTCIGCGNSFAIRDRQPITNFRKQRYCTHACGVEHRDIRGPNNPRWKGGHSNRSSKQSKWAREVISRDLATCQRCGATGVELHAHHIRSFHEHPELRWDISNGETLCFRCHWDEHTATNENAVNSGKPLTFGDEGNPEPSRNGNISEGVTTRGRAYRRWEGNCEFCGRFISKRLSDVKKHNLCSKICAGKYNAMHRSYRPVRTIPIGYGSNASTSAARESDDIV